MNQVDGKVVLITGAANGIGAEFVKVLAEHGAKHIHILDIDEKAGVLLQDKLNSKYGDNRVKFSKCDVAITEELFEAFKAVTDEFGYIDVVVNNAAVTNESNAEYIRREIDINITALINGTIKAIELMRKDKGGKGGTVINVSSVASLIKVSPLLFVYAATKSAVMQFSNCIGKDPYYTKTGVRVITICYGPTKTGIIDKMASFDEDIKIKDLVALYPMQTAEVAARGTVEAFERGESGSTWLINNGKPAKDITSTVDKAYSDMAKLLEDDTALINGTIKAIELMRKDKGGKGGTVINVSSVASLIKVSPLLFVYAATKSAVMQFSNCIGKDPYHTKTGVRVITICYGPTKTGIIDKMASFDEDIKIKDLVALYPMQTAEVAARGTVEAFERGESGSTWLINNGKPAKDITSTVDKAYSDMAKLLEDD